MYLLPQSCILENGQNAKFYVMYILLKEKEKERIKEWMRNEKMEGLNVALSQEAWMGRGER